MDSWQKHLANVVALHARAKHLESSLRFSRIMDQELSIADLIKMLARAEEVMDMYKKVYRMAMLLNDQEDEMGNFLKRVDLSAITHAAEAGMSRVNDVIKILNAKIAKYESRRLDVASANDMNYDDSGIATDRLKGAVRETLKDISDLVEYMEQPSLEKLYKQLGKLVR